MAQPDPHALLGLPADACEADIVRAYRQHARTWHPDVTDDPTAAERFVALRAAYEHLLTAAKAAPRAVPIPVRHAEPPPEPPLVVGPVHVSPLRHRPGSHRG